MNKVADFFKSIFSSIAISSAIVAFLGHLQAKEAINPQEFETLLTPKLQKEYRILSVFGEKELELHIQAILNHKVLIHDKWYKLGDKIGSYYIAHITPHTITLMDKKQSQKTLHIKAKTTAQLAQTKQNLPTQEPNPKTQNQ
ncbi:hypothetical protein [Helicobacter sp. T3_23-1056]